MPFSGEWDVGRMIAGAAALAVERVNADKAMLPKRRLEYSWADSGCSAQQGLKAMGELLGRASRVDVVIGPACSSACEVTGYLSGGQGIPQISYGATSPGLSDKNRFPLFSRTVAPETSKAPALIALMRNFDWNNVLVLSITVTSYFDSGQMLKKLLVEAGLEVKTPAAFESGKFNEAKASEIQRYGVRVVFVLAWEEDVLAIASANQGAGWAWVQIGKVGTGTTAMQGWLTVVPFRLSIQEGFAKQVSDYQSRFNLTLSPDLVNLGYSAALHDAIMLYANAATKVLAEGGDLRDGQAVTEAMRSTRFEGVGNIVVVLDQKGDRIESYEVMNYVLVGDAISTVAVGLYNSTSKQYHEYTHAVVWPSGTTKVPVSFIDPVPCKHREFLNASTHRCAVCPAGLYQAESKHGRTSCKRCSPGMFSQSQGEASCQKCSAQPGKYQPDSGQRECLACGFAQHNRTEMHAEWNRDAYSTMERGSSNASSCLCAVNEFTHSNEHMECIHCLVGARCSGFDRETGNLFAPVARRGFYGLRMHLSNDDGTQLSRYVFHQCKPERCLEVPASVQATDENSHVQSFSNLARATIC